MQSYLSSRRCDSFHCDSWAVVHYRTTLW